MRRFYFLVFSIFVLVFMAWPAHAADRRATVLRIGDTFPAVSGQTLTGRRVSFPTPGNRQPTVLVFSFSRAAASDARVWDQHLDRDFSGKATIYGVILLEDAPRLFRPMAVAGIKSSMPGPVQDWTLVLYRDEKMWKRYLRVSDSSRAYLIVLDPRGRIRWMNSGKFTQAEYMHLKDAASAASPP